MNIGLRIVSTATLIVGLVMGSYPTKATEEFDVYYPGTEALVGDQPDATVGPAADADRTRGAGPSLRPSRNPALYTMATAVNASTTVAGLLDSFMRNHS